MTAYRLRELSSPGIGLRVLVNQLEDTFCRHQHALHRAGDIGQTLDRIKNLSQGSHESGKATDSQRAGIGLVKSDKNHSGHGNRHKQLCNRRQSGIRRSCTHGEAAQARIHIHETGVFTLVAIKQLDDTLGIDSFTDHTSQLSIHVHGIAVDAAQATRHQFGHKDRGGHDQKHDHGQLPGHVKQNAQQGDHGQGFTHYDGDHLGGHASHGAGINREAVQQTASIPLLELRIGQSQQAGEHVTT